MPPKKKEKPGTQLDLTKAAASAPPAPLVAKTSAKPAVEAPRTLRYLPLMQAEDWQVLRFDLLAAEMGLGIEDAAKSMQIFHEFSEQYNSKAWLIVRRLYGIAPLFPGPNTHPDDLKTHERQDLIDAGIVPDKDTLQAELDAMRTIYSQQHPVEVAAVPVKAVEEDLALDDRLLERFGFSKDMFKLVGYDKTLNDGAGGDVPRPESENRMECGWFCEQLRYEKWQKMLVHRLYGDLARDALMNLLYLRRVQKDMAPLSSSHPRFQTLNQQKTQFSKAYQDQVEELQKKFPELGLTNESGAKGNISDLIIGQRDYYASNGGENKLVNYFCTAMELEWMLRKSVQRPSSFRFGLAVSVVEAQHGAYNPNFRSQFKPSVLKMLDAGFRSGADVVRTLLNEPMVDLTRGVKPDEPDQFPDLGPEKQPEPKT